MFMMIWYIVMDDMYDGIVGIILFMQIIPSSTQHCLLCPAFQSRARTTCWGRTGCRCAQGSLCHQWWRWPCPCPTPPSPSTLSLPLIQYLCVGTSAFHCWHSVCQSIHNNHHSTLHYLIERRIVPLSECVGRPLQSRYSPIWCWWCLRQGQRALPLAAPFLTALDRSYHPIGGWWCWVGVGTCVDGEFPSPNLLDQCLARERAS